MEEVGPVSNTHDEAVAVAMLARQRGWGQIILVTHPWHMRRAAAAFEKAGVRVICSPCPERSYDLQIMDGPADRLRSSSEIGCTRPSDSNSIDGGAGFDGVRAIDPGG